MTPYHAFANLSVQKISKTILSSCEWGHDDYTLEVGNRPKAPPGAGQQGLGFDK